MPSYASLGTGYTLSPGHRLRGSVVSRNPPRSKRTAETFSDHRGVKMASERLYLQASVTINTTAWWFPGQPA